MRRKVVRVGAIVLVVAVIAILGSGFYMLDYSLAPDFNRTDTAASFRIQYQQYPETRPWVDSLRRINALRDTFVLMPTGERHHALFVRHGSRKTAVVLHGWRNSGISVLFLARLYERLLGYNVVVPDLHAHGLSEGDMIQMGWKDRLDVKHWLTVFRTDTMVVHGVSMGAAAAMMLSAEPMPEGISDIRFVEDCGYTSVWDEFASELNNQFGLPQFPLMSVTNLLCQLRYGWSFSEASSLNAVARTTHPMLFIHGSRDTFVPTSMVYRLFNAKNGSRELWIARDAEHAQSYLLHRKEYINLITRFCQADY